MGFSKKLKIQIQVGGNTMFNFCVLSGVVCGGLDLHCPREDGAVVTFQLAIQSWDRPVGKIEITCFSRLALLAAKYLRLGDRVAVVGILLMEEWQSDDGKYRNDAKVIAIDLELIRGENHT
jgi:single-stranded DNA-binding protein